MPYFLNGNFKNNEFELVSKDKFFVDKTKMIEYINNLIGIKDIYVCITRPCRFGKAINAMILACIITLVYLSARTKYKIVREMPAGIGFADFIFYPNDKNKPAFIIELKKDSTPDEALKQIKEKRYPLALKDYTGTKLAVGITYDSRLKQHHVKIEKVK